MDFQAYSSKAVDAFKQHLHLAMEDQLEKWINRYCLLQKVELNSKDLARHILEESSKFKVSKPRTSTKSIKTTSSDVHMEDTTDKKGETVHFCSWQFEKDGVKARKGFYCNKPAKNCFNDLHFCPTHSKSMKLRQEKSLKKTTKNTSSKAEKSEIQKRIDTSQSQVDIEKNYNDIMNDSDSETGDSDSDSD